MIVTRLRGRLGNQMFQYAAGRSYAERNKQELFIDTSGLQSRGLTPRYFGLHIFTLNARIKNFDQVADDSNIIVTITQRRRGFHPEIFQVPACNNTVLEGFWQNENYFKEIEPTIRTEFTFKHSRELDTYEVSQRIKSSEAVCLHVRRTDYLMPQRSGLRFVGVEYYKNAIRMITSEVQHPHFYIFSDDIDWCKRSLCLSSPHDFVGHKLYDENATEVDLYLMTKCSHFIIANSTLSWWGAWLAQSRKKIVIAPGDWFGSPNSAAHIVPHNWVLI